MTNQMERVQSFYTTGYADKDFLTLKPMLEKLDAVLVDVRLSPASGAIQWRKDYLRLLLKNRYRHVAQLGARSSGKERIAILHLELGLQILASFNCNAVIFCECVDYQSCHRSLISEQLRRRGYAVEEIENWKTP